MPFVSRRQRRQQKAGGWTQGPALSSDQYYLTEYKGYDDCYPMARPGSIQSNPNPELAQTAMAGGARLKKQTRKQRGGNSCAEYFRTRGGSRANRNKVGGCGCLLRGGSDKRRGGAYGECPFKANSFNCPYAQEGSGKQRGGRYGFDVADSVGGNGPNVNPIVAHVPCEAARPMSINPHMPTELVSGADPDLQVAGLRPASVMLGGKRSNKKMRQSKKNKRNQKNL
jgi:hypothetical protein